MGYGVQVYLMSDFSKRLIVMLTTVWQLQWLGRDWQWANELHRR
jgi:hypothetical protein